MKKAKESVSTAIAVCLFVIFSVVFMWDFSKTVIGVTERRTQTRVEEMSDQIGKTFRIKMEDSIDYIQGVAYSLSIHDLEAEDLPRLLKSMDNDTLFSYLDVISSDGTFISSGKICDEIVDYNYFSGENKGSFGVGDHILHSKELGEVFVMYAPVYNKENVIGLVFGLLKATELEKQINAQSFEGYGNSLIFQQSGHIMVSSHDLGYDNIYDMLHNVEFPNGGSKEQVLYTVKNGGRDYLSVKADGVDTFVAFSPVGVNDWYIATGVTKAYMANYADAIVDAAKRLSLKYIAMFMVFLAYVGWRMIRSKEQVEQAYDELKISHRMFEIAIEGTNDAIFNYDIRTKEANYARRPEYVKAPYDTRLENLPEDYEKYFSLHPDYVESYVEMYRAVRSGKPV
ncbi:MAG: cache domain-containing protein, partial [Oscillospiraceae bacterium]